MNTTKPIINDDAVFKDMTYAQFHLKLLGKHFLNNKGEILTKLDVWRMHSKEPTMIKMILQGTARQYHAVDKDGWRDGKLV